MSVELGGTLEYLPVLLLDLRDVIPQSLVCLLDAQRALLRLLQKQIMEKEAERGTQVSQKQKHKEFEKVFL